MNEMIHDCVCKAKMNIKKKINKKKIENKNVRYEQSKGKKER